MIGEKTRLLKFTWGLYIYNLYMQGRVAWWWYIIAFLRRGNFVFLFINIIFIIYIPAVNWRPVTTPSIAYYNRFFIL